MAQTGLPSPLQGQRLAGSLAPSEARPLPAALAEPSALQGLAVGGGRATENAGEVSLGNLGQKVDLWVAIGGAGKAERVRPA